MPNQVCFFAIHADDVDRAKNFYQSTFGWTFNAWAPNFFLIEGAGIRGSLQQRQTPLSGDGFRGYECTIAVDSIDKAQQAVETAGGKITMPKMELPSVGTMIKFTDTEGNHACAMQYEPGVEY